MTTFALSSSVQSDSCSHENLACWLDSRIFATYNGQQLDSHEEHCATCREEQEGSSAGNSLDLQETNRLEQESELAQTNDIPDDKGFSHQWTNRDDEFLESIYDITNRLPGWLFLGKHIYPMMEQDELSAYISLPPWAEICPNCHLQYNKFMGCLDCGLIRYRNTSYNYWIA